MLPVFQGLRACKDVRHDIVDVKLEILRNHLVDRLHFFLMLIRLQQLIVRTLIERSNDQRVDQKHYQEKSCEIPFRQQMLRSSDEANEHVQDRIFHIVTKDEILHDTWMTFDDENHHATEHGAGQNQNPQFEGKRVN